MLGIDPLSGGHRFARQTAFLPRRTCLAGPQTHHVDLATATVVRSVILAPSPDASGNASRLPLNRRAALPKAAASTTPRMHLAVRVFT